MSVKKKIGKNIFFSLLLTSLFLLLLEFSARFYGYIKHGNPAVFLYGRGLVHEMAKSIAGPSEKNDSSADTVKLEKMADELFERRFSTTCSPKTRTPGYEMLYGYPSYINRFGFRNRDIELEKDPGITRMMALGGSFVMCLGTDDESTWERILEKRLNATGNKYEIINAGQPGYTINNLPIFFIEQAAAFKPDYIIFTSAYNNHRLLKPAQALSPMWRISNFLYSASYLYSILRDKICLLLYKDTDYTLYNYRIKIDQREVDGLISLYRRRLEQLYTLCVEKNIEIILCLQPEYIPHGLKDLQNMMDEKKMAYLEDKVKTKKYLLNYEFRYYVQGRLNLEMKRFSDEKGILSFDGTSIFPQNKRPYFIDEIHMSREGAAVFADELYKFLSNKGIVGELPREESII